MRGAHTVRDGFAEPFDVIPINNSGYTLSLNSQTMGDNGKFHNAGHWGW